MSINTLDNHAHDCILFSLPCKQKTKELIHYLNELQHIYRGHIMKNISFIHSFVNSLYYIILYEKCMHNLFGVSKIFFNELIFLLAWTHKSK